MSEDASKKPRLDETATPSTNPPKNRKRLADRDVLHKVFGTYYDKICFAQLQRGNDALAMLFVLSQLGHRYVLRLLQSVTVVTVEAYRSVPVMVTDAFAAELFRRGLLNPRKLMIYRHSNDVLPAVQCIGLYELAVTDWPITSELGNAVVRIVNMNAKTLKKIRDFPAQYVHLLDSETLNLDELSLSGELPAGAEKTLPRTKMFVDNDHVVFPAHVHLLNSKKLSFSSGLHESVPGEYEVNTSCPHVEEITIHETAEDDPWMDTNWVEQLKQLRRAFPNWRHLEISNCVDLRSIDLDEARYDECFVASVEKWFESFEAHLRQDTAPLRIDAAEGHFRATDLPDFKMDVKKAVREVKGERVTETTFSFTRDEDFGQGRILCMEAWVHRHVRDGAELTTSEEEDEKDGNESGHHH
ncbi:hypothetical protein AAVH_25836 [Aphelenchoides avenae]|nr:hypothetical protein AAVH_25836 [Aphelenchus avenae]